MYRHVNAIRVVNNGFKILFQSMRVEDVDCVGIVFRNRKVQ